MIRLLKNKKLLIALLVVFVVTGGVFILGACQAHAILNPIDWISGKAIGGAFAWIMDIVLSFFSKFLGLAAGLLEAVFKMTGITKDANQQPIPLVQNGWAITRGLANMFFALILLIMAVSTVLGLESFGARRLLIRLIISALLINFSLLFAGIIIDFAQVLTNYFITAAGGTVGISTNFANGLNIASVFADPTNFNTVMSVGDATALINLGIGMLFGIIVIAIATFVMLAASIFLIVRIAALWLLLIFAPLAWVSMIVPGGMVGSLWGRWWKSFFQYTFFAPIYAFFLFLAAMAVGSGSFKQAFANASAVPNNSGILSGFFGQTMPFILQYVVVIIILCGGLLVAKEFGVVGASTVINAGKRAGKGVAKWTGRQAARPAQYGYEKASAAATAAAGKALSKIPGFSKAGGRLQAKATQMKEKPEERKQHKAYAKLTKTMSDADLANETKSALGVRKLIAAREAKERGVLAKTENKEVVQQAMKTFSTYGAKTLNAQGKDDGKTKEQRELEETRFDAIENEAEQKEAIRRSKESGTLDKINPIVLKDAKVMEHLQEELSAPGEFADTFKKWGKKTKEEAEKAMRANFTDDFTDSKEVTRRENFARSTGKLSDAFYNKKVGLHNDASAENYITKMTPTQVSEIYKEEDLRVLARHVDAAQLDNPRGLSGYQKQTIKVNVQLSGKATTKDQVNKNPGWQNV